jgi:hypothetical protein
MRPYIALVDPGFIPQNRATPYFAEAQLTMINTGHTPAHNIRFAAYLKVLPVVLPEDFDFAIRPNEIIVSGHINPGQRLFFRRNIGGLLADDEYDAIIQGRSMQTRRALCAGCRRDRGKIASRFLLPNRPRSASAHPRNLGAHKGS